MASLQAIGTSAFKAKSVQTMRDKSLACHDQDIGDGWPGTILEA